MPSVLVNGTGGDDTLVVTAITSNSGFYSLNGGPLQGFATGVGESFTFNGLAGADTFTITNPVGDLFAPDGNISYNAGGDLGDTLNNFGGTALNGSYFTFSPIQSQIDHVNGVVTQRIFYLNAGATPITDTVSEPQFTVFGIAAGDDAISVTDGGLVDGGATTQVDSPSFVGIRVRNRATLVINGNGGNDTLDFNNPNPAAGLNEVDVVNVGAVTQTGAVNYTNLGFNNVAGPVTLPGSNNVTTLAAALSGAGNAFSFNDVNDLAIGSVGGVNSITTNNGNVTVTTVDGNLLVADTNGPLIDINAGNASISLTAGGAAGQDRLLTLDANADINAAGGITLTADNLNNIGANLIAGAAAVTLQPFEAGTLIDLGGPDGANTLGLTDAELDRPVAGVVRVGNSTAGSISISNAISPAGTSQLELVTGADIQDNNFGTDITVARLGMTAQTGIGVAGPFAVIDFQVGNLEAQTNTGGIFIQQNVGALTIGGVNGTLTGLSVGTSGNIEVAAAGNIILADNDGLETILGGSASGDVSLTAGGATSDVTSTVNGDAITAPAGSITVTAGRDILFGTGGANFDNDVRADVGITFNAGRDITIDGFTDIVADDFRQQHRFRRHLHRRARHQHHRHFRQRHLGRRGRQCWRRRVLAIRLRCLPAPQRALGGRRVLDFRRRERPSRPGGDRQPLRHHSEQRHRQHLARLRPLGD